LTFSQIFMDLQILSMAGDPLAKKSKGHKKALPGLQRLDGHAHPSFSRSSSCSHWSLRGLAAKTSLDILSSALTWP
jgi:hypothetical protein